MFHGGWCWEPLKDRLEADGHRVIAPDLAGCGDDPTPASEITLDRWAGDIAALAAQAGEPVILVGHSRGGLVASQAAERAGPDAVAAIVYLTALLLPDGQSAFTLQAVMAGQQVEGPSLDVRFSEDGLSMLPPADAIDRFFAECTPAIRAWAAPRVKPEAMAPLATPVSLSDARYGAITRVYIETTLDRTVPIAAQRAMIGHSPVAAVYTMETDHSPQLSHVDDLAGILEHIARRHAAGMRDLEDAQ
jgi:pimeloyl-ACP methyl ester carboxylesterase